jgi:hypothetical protein
MYIHLKKLSGAIMESLPKEIAKEIADRLSRDDFNSLITSKLLSRTTEKFLMISQIYDIYSCELNSVRTLGLIQELTRMYLDYYAYRQTKFFTIRPISDIDEWTSLYNDVAPAVFKLWHYIAFRTARDSTPQTLATYCDSHSKTCSCGTCQFRYTLYECMQHDSGQRLIDTCYMVQGTELGININVRVPASFKVPLDELMMSANINTLRVGLINW